MSVVVENGNTFHVEHGVLIELRACEKDQDVVIPHTLKNGEEIKTLGSAFCQGKYGKITISDKIGNVERNAFEWADVEEVHWSYGCRIIPVDCFRNSKIRKISNIDNVVEIWSGAFSGSSIGSFTAPPLCKVIGDEAFAYSRLDTAFLDVKSLSHIGKSAFRSTNISEIIWSHGCPTIPERCFYESSVGKISNIQDVRGVRNNAFADCKIDKLEWPKNCPEIPEFCFWDCSISELSGLNHIQIIKRGAFGISTIVSKLDISGSPVSIIELGAFAGLKRENIALPYYITPKMIDDAFSWWVGD